MHDYKSNKVLGLRMLLPLNGSTFLRASAGTEMLNIRCVGVCVFVLIMRRFGIFALLHCCGCSAKARSYYLRLYQESVRTISIFASIFINGIFRRKIQTASI